MTNLRLPAILAAAVTLGNIAVAQSPSQQTETALPNTDLYPVGETLWYEAKIGLFRVGRATMEILEVDTVRAEPALHVRFRLEGGWTFFELDDKMDSWINLEDFTSRRFIQDFREGGRHRVNSYEIYPDSGFYTREGIDTTMVTSEQPLDDAAFFYFVRTVDMVPGNRYEFNNYFKPDRNPVVLEVIGRDTIEVPAGRFATLEVRPIINGNGIFREAADARLWLTDDERKLVVKMKSRFSFAVITLRLTKIEGVPEQTP